MPKPVLFRFGFILELHRTTALRISNRRLVPAPLALRPRFLIHMPKPVLFRFGFILELRGAMRVQLATPAHSGLSPPQARWLGDLTR